MARNLLFVLNPNYKDILHYFATIHFKASFLETKLAAMHAMQEKNIILERFSLLQHTNTTLCTKPSTKFNKN